MALAYASIPEKDFSFGIDARSAENQIEPGFVRDLLNADIVEKRVRKRPGYQGYAGNIPIRVTQLEYDNTTDDICFILPEGVSLEASGISLETTPSSPIVVYGRTSAEFSGGDGPFYDSADNVKYYPGFTVPIRKSLTAGTGTLVFPGTEHGLQTTNLFIGIVESTSLTERDYEDIGLDNVRINETSFDISIDYTTAVDRNVFVYFGDKDTVTGDSYVYTATAVPVGIQTITIPAATHNLSAYNIIPTIQQDTGTERLEVMPDSFEIATNGTVTVTVNNGTGAAVDYYVILSAAPVANVVTGVVNASDVGEVVISGVTSPWIFYGIYLEQTPGGTKELVMPDDISYDDSASEVTISFTNAAATARSFIIYYEYGVLRSNRICVMDSAVTVSGIDTRPQLTIWGLNHDEIYPDPKSVREGWTTHIDSYRRSGEQRLICGLGGNIFSAQTYTEAATQYAYPQLYPNLYSRTSVSSLLGPLFWGTGDTPARTRGYITADDSATHWGMITAVEYDTGTGWTKHTISLPGMLILDSAGSPTTIGNVISTTTGLEDWLTVSRMSYARHNGTFQIKQVTSGVNEIYIWVENDDNSADFDDDGIAGQAGVFTDQMNWTAAAPYIEADELISDALGDTHISAILSSDGTTSVSDGWVDILEIPAGVLFLGNRTSSVVPLRSGYPTASGSTTNLVRGDMLSYTGIDRLLRVVHINPDQDRSVDISVTSEVATVTMNAGDTSYLTAGMEILLTQAGAHSGVHEILDVISDTEFTYETQETDSVTGATLLGETAQIDETLEFEDTQGDTNVFTVEQRWIPVEAPDDSFNLTPSTYIRHLDYNAYVAQTFLRSTMVVDNMYFTNNADEVIKYDGSSIYRSGLISWQPGLFLTQSTTGATIVVNNRSVSYSAISAAKGRLTITGDDVEVIPVGSSIRLTGSSETYTVRAYSEDDPAAPTAFYLLVDRALDTNVSATGTASEIALFRYYFRLNAVDVNDNIIASAVTGYQDHVAELTVNAAIELKLVGMPAWDIYDYDRLEVQIYRTKQNTAAPFYLVTTLPMDFDNTQGYLQFRDAFADSDLTQLDVVNTALKGAELGTSWSDPLRAKYITSIGNKLILGNLRDYPQLDLQVVGDATISSSDFAGDTLLFRRDNTDTSTTVDMTNVVQYEWRSTASATSSNFVIGVDEFSFDTNIPIAGIVAGSWVYLTYDISLGGGPAELDYSGWWQVKSAVTAGITTVTINLTGATAAGNYPNRVVVATNSLAVPVYLGRDDSLGMLNGDSFDTFDATRRLSMAINASMRMVDVSLSGYEEFTPWLIARSGNDTPPGGRILIRQPRTDEYTFEMVPTFSGYSLFVNSVRRSTGDQISAAVRSYPSRIIASYENYPEIFDAPTVILDGDSDSAVDVNSADGQEITGVIPFFGEAAFTASQQAAILVVFKTNSIYLVDLNQKAAGQNAVQRIETEGLGCTAPYSIAVTKGGIMFANESGIYCLRRNQSIEYIGKYMERNWTERVDLEKLDIAQGHHYGIGRSYKLSVPIDDPDSEYIEPSETYVYNHTGESEGKIGAWGRYDNHPSIGWANLGSDAFFASTKGRVFSVRNTGSVSDYRDDSEAINLSLRTRPNDFGDTGRRKIVDKVIIDYRVGAENTGTGLNYSVDLEEEYEETGAFIVPKPADDTGLFDVVARDVVTIDHSLARRRVVYLSVEVTNTALDENVEISGITYRVAALSEKGILQAAKTR